MQIASAQIFHISFNYDTVPAYFIGNGGSEERKRASKKSLLPLSAWVQVNSSSNYSSENCQWIMSQFSPPQL
jgi:hypothetical protein